LITFADNKLEIPCHALCNHWKWWQDLSSMDYYYAHRVYFAHNGIW